MSKYYAVRMYQVRSCHDDLGGIYKPEAIPSELMNFDNVLEPFEAGSYKEAKSIAEKWFFNLGDIQNLELAQLRAERDALQARVAELEQDAMTNEYNEAEAELFAPEYERQIREQTERALGE